MVRRRVARYAIGFALTLGMWAVFASTPVLAKTAGNPTPCENGGVRGPTSIVMGGDVVYVKLQEFGTGYLPNCYFSYYETVWTKYGSTINGHWSVRVWVCGSYQGDYGTNYSINGSNQSYGTPSFYYGSCGEQADDYNLYLFVNGQQYTVPYNGIGYLSF